MLAAAPHLAHELPRSCCRGVWGGATFDVALRFLHEDRGTGSSSCASSFPRLPADAPARARTCRLLALPTKVVRAFVAESVEAGIDVFPIFDL